MLRVRRLRLQIASKDCSNISHPLNDSDDLQRAGLGIIDHDVVPVAANRPEAKRKAGQVFANVPPHGTLCQKSTRFVNGRSNSVGSLHAVLGDVIPNFDEIVCRLRSEAVGAHALC